MQHKAGQLWLRSPPEVELPRVRSNPSKASLAVIHTRTAHGINYAFFVNVSVPYLPLGSQSVASPKNALSDHFAAWLSVS